MFRAIARRTRASQTLESAAEAAARSVNGLLQAQAGAPSSPAGLQVNPDQCSLSGVGNRTNALVIVVKVYGGSL